MQLALKLEVANDGTILSVRESSIETQILDISPFLGKKIADLRKTCFVKEFHSSDFSAHLSLLNGIIRLFKVLEFKSAGYIQIELLETPTLEQAEQHQFLQNHHSLFESQPEASLFLNTSGEIIWKNKKAQDIFSIENDLSQIQDCLFSDKKALASNLFDAWAEQKRVIYSMEFSSRVFDLIIVPLFYNADELLGFRIEINAVQISKKEDLGNFPIKNPNPVLRISDDGNIVFSNPAASIFIVGKQFHPVVNDQILQLLFENSSHYFSGKIAFEEMLFHVDFVRSEANWNLFFVDITEISRINKLQSISKSQLEAIISSSRSAIVLLNEDKDIIYYNQRARLDSKRYLGVELIIGSKLEDFADNNVYRTIDVAIQTVFNSKNQITFDLDFEIRGEKKAWFSFTVYPIKYDDDSVNGVCLNMTNISSAKYAEEEIRSTRNFYETVLNNIPADLAVFDLNHNYLFLNPTAVKSDELRKWMIGKTDYDFFRKKGLGTEIADKRRVIFNKTIAENKTQEIVDEHIDKDGQTRYVMRRFYPYSDNQGELKLVIGYGIEITQIKNAERYIQSSEKKFRSLFENNPMLIFIIDQKFQIVSLNNAVEKHLNISGENNSEPISFLSLVRQDLCEEFTSKFLKAFNLEEGESYTCYCDLQFENAEYKIEFSATPIYSESGEKQLMLVGADQTERLNNEELLRKSESFNRHLVEQIPIPFAIVNFDRAQFINDSMRELFDIPLGLDYKDLSIFDFVLDEHKPIVRQAIANRYAGIDAATPLLKILTFNKRKKVVEINGSLIEIGGKTLSFISMVDRTAELEQSKLRKSAELKAQQIIDTALDAVISTDSEGNIQIWNPKAEKIFGWSASEVQGKNISDTIIPHVHRKGHSHGMEMHMLTGKSSVLNKLIELTALRKSGEQFPIEIFITRIEIDHEIIFSSFIRDISLKKKAEFDLIASESKLSLLVQSLPVVPYTMELDKIYSFNYLDEKIHSLLGYSESEVKSKPEFWISKVHPDDAQYLEESCLVFDSSLENVSIYRILDANGRWKWLRDTSKLTLNNDGYPTFISGVFNDITQQKETEDLRRQVEVTLYEISRKDSDYADSLSEFYSLIFTKLNENFGFTGFSLWELNSDKSHFVNVVNHSSSQQFVHSSIVKSEGTRILLELFNDINLSTFNQNEIVTAQGNTSLNTIFELPDNISSTINIVNTELSNGMIMLIESDQRNFIWENEHYSLIGSISELISFNLEYFHRVEADLKLRKAYSLAGIGAWEIEEGRDSVFWSEAMYEFYGFVPNSIEPMLFNDILPFIHPDDLEEFKDSFYRLTNEGIPYRLECRHVLPNSSIRYFEKSAVAITAISGKRIFMGVTVDITERKYAEVERNDRLQRKAVENAIVVSIASAINLDELLLKFVDMLCQSKIVKQCFLFSDQETNDYFNPKFTYPIVLEFDNPIYSALNVEVQNHFMNMASNEVFFLEEPYGNYLLLPMQLPESGRCCFVFESDDIDIERQGIVSLFTTLKKRLQEKAELIHAEAQLRLLNNELLDTNLQLRQYSYIVSHNLRAPVANILGCIDLYNEDDPADPRNVELIDGLKISSRSVDNILRDLNKILNIKENVINHFELISFKDVLGNVLDALKTEIVDVDYLLETDFMSVQEIRAFKPYLVSVFQNLVSNAFKYRSKERKLELKISTRVEQRNIVLTFSDNGRGIDLEKHGSKLFKLYSRLHTDIPGSGLGLNMVQEQVRAMGGNIQIESKEGEGTVFIVTFINKQ
jgi:PAS domain S-box-containing protein